MPGLPGRDGRDATAPEPPAPSTEMFLSVPTLSAMESPVLSFSLGVSTAGSVGGVGGGGASGRTDFQPLNVTKVLDGLSIPLLRAASNGVALPEMILTVFDVTGGSSVLVGTYRFREVYVVSDVIGGNGVTSIAEQVSFDYGVIESRVVLNGTTYQACYDVKRSLSC